MAFDKELKKLKKAYRKKLKYFNKQSLKQDFVDISYLIVYLQFIRDQLVFTSKSKDIDNLKLATIATAIDEYEQYSTCIYKYFKAENNKLVPLKQQDEKNVLKEYLAEKHKHWCNFCDLLKENYRIWEADYDTSIQ